MPNPILPGREASIWCQLFHWRLWRLHEIQVPDHVRYTCLKCGWIRAVRNPEPTPLMLSNEEAEKVAQAALRGWFSDPLGFKDMKEQGNQKAVKAVLTILKG